MESSAAAQGMKAAELLPPNKRNSGELEGRNVELLDTKRAHRGGAPDPARGGGDACSRAVTWISVALALTAFVVGTAGLLVYIDQLQIALTNVGSMSAVTGLYTMLGGFGLTFVVSVVMFVRHCMDASRANGQKPKTA